MKQKYPLDFKTQFGVSTMGIGANMTASIFLMMFMIYITDYSGLFVGVPGKAAAVATGLLFAGRIFDAINDPILAVFVDSRKENKFGKYRTFVVIGGILAGITCILCFNIPKGLSDPLTIFLLYTFYFSWSIGITVSSPFPLVSTLSDDKITRSKLVAQVRIVSIVSAVFVAVGVPLTEMLDGNMGLVVIIFMAPLILISLIGAGMVKERSVSREKEKVSMQDMLNVCLKNKPLQIMVLSRVFGGFTFTVITGASIYYLKYAFGPENFEAVSMAGNILTLISSILGTVVITKFVKKWGSGKIYSKAYLFQAVLLIALFAIHSMGMMTQSIYFVLMFCTYIFITGVFVPTQLLFMECMDYNEKFFGNPMSAIVNATNTMVEKTQNALSAVVVGAVLVMVGYDAELYKDASQIPKELLSNLGIIMFLIPAILAILGFGVFCFYPKENILLETNSATDN